MQKIMDYKKRYKDYSPRVVEWMNKLIDEMSNEMGEIPESYVIQFDILADTCAVLNEATEDIRKNGIVVAGRKGERVKNCSCAIWNAASLQISKLLNQLVATRSSKVRLKMCEDDNTSPLDEYID